MIIMRFRRKKSGLDLIFRFIQAARRTLAYSRCVTVGDLETLARIQRALDDLREETFYAELNCRFHVGGPEALAPLPRDDPPPPWLLGS